MSVLMVSSTGPTAPSELVSILTSVLRLTGLDTTQLSPNSCGTIRLYTYRWFPSIFAGFTEDEGNQILKKILDTGRELNKQRGLDGNAFATGSACGSRSVPLNLLRSHPCRVLSAEC